ncbi:MAG: metal ABC transporter permease [Patescibacteria group bacterium]
MIVGLVLSYIFDLPSGATIVLVGVCSFLLLAFIQLLFAVRRT